MNNAEPEFDAADWPLLAFAVRRLRHDRELMLPRGVREQLADLDERLVRVAVAAQTVDVPPVHTSTKPVSSVPTKSTITVAEMATRMGCSPQYVRKLCRDKRLPARWTSAGWLIDAVPDVDVAS